MGPVQGGQGRRSGAGCIPRGLPAQILRGHGVPTPRTLERKPRSNQRGALRAWGSPSAGSASRGLREGRRAEAGLGGCVGGLASGRCGTSAATRPRHFPRGRRGRPPPLPTPAPASGSCVPRASGEEAAESRARGSVAATLTCAPCTAGVGGRISRVGCSPQRSPSPLPDRAPPAHSVWEHQPGLRAAGPPQTRPAALLRGLEAGFW